MTKTRIGITILKVKNLAIMLDFYQHIIGLKLITQQENRAHLGVGDTTLLILNEDLAARPVKRVTGLYHFALLVPERYQLALALKHFAETQTPLQGMSDHIVSEAIYLADPEGNGIEIYWDKPRERWYKNGEMQLATLPMDVAGVLSELNERDTTWQGLPDGTTIGHIHLHVANLPENEQFYSVLLGLDVMFNMGSASFLSYDDYHHHIGINIWAGSAAPPTDATGLQHFNLHLTDDEYDIAVARLQNIKISMETIEQGIQVIDPTGNQIKLIYI
ncbi:MAG: VOC family protein [Aggregatilineales bacterium]